MIRRNKAVMLLLMPFAFVLLAVGWSLQWVGSKKAAAKLKVAPSLRGQKSLTLRDYA